MFLCRLGAGPATLEATDPGSLNTSGDQDHPGGSPAFPEPGTSSFSSSASRSSSLLLPAPALPVPEGRTEAGGLPQTRSGISEEQRTSHYRRKRDESQFKTWDEEKSLPGSGGDGQICSSGGEEGREETNTRAKHKRVKQHHQSVRDSKPFNTQD